MICVSYVVTIPTYTECRSLAPVVEKRPPQKKQMEQTNPLKTPGMTSWHGLVCRENLFTKMSHPVRCKINMEPKITHLKSGKSSSKPSFSGSMIIFRGVHHGFMWPWFDWFLLPLKSRDYLDWHVSTHDAGSSLKGGCSQKRFRNPELKRTHLSRFLNWVGNRFKLFLHFFGGSTSIDCRGFAGGRAFSGAGKCWGQNSLRGGWAPT